MFGTAALPRPPLLLANRRREILVRESLRVPGRPLAEIATAGVRCPGGTSRRRRHPRPRRIAGRFSRGGTIARIAGAEDLDDDFQPPAEPITKVVNDRGQRTATPLRSADFGELLRGLRGCPRGTRSRRYGRAFAARERADVTLPVAAASYQAAAPRPSGSTREVALETGPRCFNSALSGLQPADLVSCTALTDDDRVDVRHWAWHRALLFCSLLCHR